MDAKLPKCENDTHVVLPADGIESDGVDVLVEEKCSVQGVLHDRETFCAEIVW